MFHSARIKLTAYYILIIMVISLSFSGVIYQGWRNEVDRFEQAQRTRFQRRLENIVLPDGRIIQPLPVTDPELLEEAKTRLLTLLGFINGSILVLAGGLSYFLAGKTLDPIQKMVEDQNRFIGDASHELRTPLASLKTAFEVWLRDKNKTTKEAKNIITESVVEVNRLTMLTNSLLLSINNQPSANNNHFENVSITDVIGQSVKRINPLIKDMKISVKNTVNNTSVIGDKLKLTELFTILLDNAVKYGNKGGWIKIGSTRQGKFISITVEDNGQGIASADLPRIFDRFYRTDGSRTKQDNNGFGLGLSIAKQIVDNHHGIIGVKSRIGKGTTFTVKLPLS